MMKREQIFLSKNFTVIESDIPFTLKFNIKDNTANSAEDVINFKSGWYIFDNNKLLPQYVDGVYNLPKYNCWIEFDETLGTTPPNWYTCYINPKSVESLSSEVTELDPAQLAGLRQDIQTNGGKIDGLELLVNGFKSANNADLSAVKTSVDALQVSNHTDSGVVKDSVDSLGDLLVRDTMPGSSASANLFDLLRTFEFYGSNFVYLFGISGVETVSVFRQLTSVPHTPFQFYTPCFYSSDFHIYNVTQGFSYWISCPKSSYVKISFENQSGANIDVRVILNGVDNVYTINWGGLQMDLYKVSPGNFKEIVD